jgi:CRP/FNR family transcriptional regulator, cyclic AMP receptor protein
LSVTSLLKLSELSEVFVLEADPDLGADIPPDVRPEAVKESRAPLSVFPLGEWQFDPPPDPTALGALILEGMLVLRIGFGGSTHLEVLGEEDILNPWHLEIAGALEQQASVHVVQSGFMALLDRDFALRMARWPEVFAALMRRLVRRARRMIIQTSILSRPRADERFELMLWQLADRFGNVTPEGLLVRLPFTHDQLGEMVGAKRSTVTLAVSQLVAEDRRRIPGRKQWLLPHHELTPLTALSHPDARVP